MYQLLTIGHLLSIGTQVSSTIKLLHKIPITLTIYMFDD